MSTPGTKVVLLRWPHDESALERLRDERRPRLLLVDPDGPTPEIADELEDWVRVPAPQQDIQARILVLEQRSHQQQSTDLEIDDDGVLTVRNDQIVLGPIAAALFRALLERDGAVISRDDLMRAGWTSGDATRNMLDVQIKRLRTSLEPFGLGITTVRSRGYRLDRRCHSG